MLKLLKTPFQKATAIIAVIVDVYSLIQIFQQTRFTMPDVFSNPWFWLFVIMTVAMAIMFAYFKYRDFKRKIAAYKNDMEAYKGRVREEFYKRMEEEGKLHERCNRLYWQIEELKSEILELKKAQTSQQVI